MTLTEVLARFIIQSRSTEIDRRTIEHARATIADCIGCMIAGAGTDVARSIRRVVGSAHRGSSSAVATAARLDAASAALLNGAAAHALDYDDVSWTLYGHPSVAILPCAMAIAEARGGNGLDLVRAYVIGVEVAAKLGHWANPTHYEHGWHATATLGVIGATAAGAALLGLDAQQTAMALGIAASESAGVRRNFGTMTKPFHAGNAARGGVLAAELGQAGMTSDIRALEGRFGWFASFQGQRTPSAEELESVLGEPWEVDSPGIVIKRYPACGATHCALDALLDLRKEQGFTEAEIESIHCAAHPLAAKVLLYPQPKTGLEGKFSMEYCLAVAAVDGHPKLRHFSDEWIADSRILSLLPRISFESRDDLAVTPSADGVPAEIVVRLRNGKELSRTVMVPAGDPRNPVSASDRWHKFSDCADGVRDPDAIEKMWGLLETLDRQPDTAELMTMLRGR